MQYSFVTYLRVFLVKIPKFVRTKSKFCSFLQRPMGTFTFSEIFGINFITLCDHMHSADA